MPRINVVISAYIGKNYINHKNNLADDIDVIWLGLNLILMSNQAAGIG